MSGTYQLIFTIVIMLSFGWHSAMAADATSIHGKIVATDGTPLTKANVSFVLQVLSPDESCLIYSEQVDNVDMTSGRGEFDLSVGTGTKIFPTGTFKVSEAFANSTALNCQGGATYSPAANANRKLRVQFHDGTGWKVFTPTLAINASPYSWHAGNADKLGNMAPSDFVLKSSVNGNATCSSGNFLTWDSTSMTFGCAAGSAAGALTDVTSSSPYLSATTAGTSVSLNLAVGTSAGTLASGSDSRFSDARTPTGTASGDLSGNYPNPTVSRIDGVTVDLSTTPTANQVLKYNGTSWVAGAAATGTVTSVTAGTGLTGGTITNSGTIGLGTELLAVSNLSSTGYIKRNGAGSYSSTAGSTTPLANTLVMRDAAGVTQVTGLDLLTGSGAITLKSPAVSSNYSITFPSAAGSSGQVLGTSGSGNLGWMNFPQAPVAACGTGEVLTYNGSSFTCVPDQVGSTGGLASLNGQSDSSQSFAYSTVATSPTWSSASGIHTLKIPMASSAGVTAGLLSKTEYDTFNGKQANLGFTPLNPNSNLIELANVATARTNLGLGSAATKNTPGSGNASTSEVVLGTDTRLTDSRAPAGAASGDLSGNYPSPTVAKIKNYPVTITTPSNGQILTYSGGSWINQAPAAPVPAAGSITDSMLDATTVGIWDVSGSNIMRTTGNVGIGTVAPTTKLEVQGQFRSVSSTGAATVNSGTSVNWNNGNSQSMSSACTATTLTNMKDGGTYILAITDTQATKCIFTHSGLTFVYSPANAARTSGTLSVYTFLVVGTRVYVSWITGFE